MAKSPVKMFIHGVHIEFDADKCNGGMDLILWAEKKAGGPPAVDERWNALQARLAEEKANGQRTRSRL